MIFETLKGLTEKEIPRVREPSPCKSLPCPQMLQQRVGKIIKPMDDHDVFWFAYKIILYMCYIRDEGHILNEG